MRGHGRSGGRGHRRMDTIQEDLQSVMVVTDGDLASMGGLVTLYSLQTRSPEVRCVALFNPLLGLFKTSAIKVAWTDPIKLPCFPPDKGNAARLLGQLVVEAPIKMIHKSSAPSTRWGSEYFEPSMSPQRWRLSPHLCS